MTERVVIDRSAREAFFILVLYLLAGYCFWVAISEDPAAYIDDAGRYSALADMPTGILRALLIALTGILCLIASGTLIDISEDKKALIADEHGLLRESVLKVPGLFRGNQFILWSDIEKMSLSYRGNILYVFSNHRRQRIILTASMLKQHGAAIQHLFDTHCPLFAPEIQSLRKKID